MKLIVIISSIIFVIDQIIKLIISNFLEINHGISIINDFFSLMYVRNYGAAFSIFNGNRLFLIIVSILSVILIYKFLLKDKKIGKLESVIYGVLLGGLFGNLLDRIILGYVIDYLSFKIFGYYFPVFNFADMCIVISTVFLILIVGSEKNENNSDRGKKIR